MNKTKMELINRAWELCKELDEVLTELHGRRFDTYKRALLQIIRNRADEILGWIVNLP